jgi:hypothetical protein
MNQPTLDNLWTKGVDRDTDPHYLPADRARSLQNMRIRSVNGEQMAVVNVGGMRQEFALTPNFWPIGSVSSGGVLFIFSVNSTTGEGEIGTFPSPRTNGLGGYDHVYRPLQNWTGAQNPNQDPVPPRLDLRTTLFLFDCTKPIEAEAQLSYDGTVNLFWTDNFNPLRWINTGFVLATGAYNEELYWDGSLVNAISVFAETCKHLTTGTNYAIVSGGSLQGGMYFFYAGYADIAFNPTSFLSELGPFQMTADSAANGVYLNGTEGLELTGKSIVLTLSNVDINFPYLQFAVVYCHDDVVEVNRIVKFYPINNQTTVTVTINGLEELGDLTIAELLRQKGELDTVKSIAQLDKRLWGGNWRKSTICYTETEDILKQVAVTAPPIAELLEERHPMPWLNTQPASGSQNYQKTHDEIGYFRGEAYVFAIQLVYNDGRLSLPFAIQGSDAWFGGAVNEKGIFRFPSNNSTDALGVDSYAYLRAGAEPTEAYSRTMGVRFDTTAVPFAAWPACMRDNVCGFYILRGDRKPNMTYQGFVTKAFGGVTLHDEWDTPTIGPTTSLWGLAINSMLAVGVFGLDPITALLTIWFLTPGGGGTWTNASGTNMNVTAYGNDVGMMPEISFGILGGGYDPGFLGTDYLEYPIRATGTLPLLTNGYPQVMDMGLLQAKGIAEHRFGLFSNDHFFRRSLIDAAYPCYLQGHAKFHRRSYITPSTYIRPSWQLDTKGFVSWGTETGDFVAGNSPHSLLGCWNVPEASLSSYGPGFVSKYTEGNKDNVDQGNPVLIWLLHDATGFFGLTNENWELGNREMDQRNYIGLGARVEDGAPDLAFSSELRNVLRMNFILADAEVRYPVVNIYLRDPDPANGFVLESEYQPELTTYHRVSEFLPVADWDTLVTKTFYRGDCFLNRVYHRHLHSGGYRDNDFAENVWEGGSNTGEARYWKYGNLVGTIQECSINTGMRIETGTSSPGPGRFYPEAGLAFGSNYGHFPEEFSRNEGYERMLGLFGFLGYDVLVPFRNTEYITRIWHSHMHEPTDLINGYRYWDLGAAKDYDTRSGPINKVASAGNRLFSVQQSAINMHPINREAVIRPDASEGELLIGNGEILPDKAVVLSSEYGTQHQRSVVVTDKGIYGYDQEKRKVWGMNNALSALSDELFFARDVVQVSQFLSEHSDITHLYPDAPVCSGGVQGWWDRRHSEVGWTWNVFEIIDDNNQFRYQETLVLNELFRTYQHRRTHHSPFYALLNEDLYSADPSFLGPFASQTGAVPFYLHDAQGEPMQTFYGQQQTALLGWTVHTSPKVKHQFQALHLHGSDIPLSSVQFATQFQQSELDPFISLAIWLTPRYRENAWRFPVPYADTVTPSPGAQEYQAGSAMRGAFLLVDCLWATPHPVTVHLASTILHPSYV